jgi:hypothetical protein
MRGQRAVKAASMRRAVNVCLSWCAPETRRMLEVTTLRQPAAFQGSVHRGLVERRRVMGEMLAAFIFAVIIFGFMGLMLVPLVFAVLAFGVFREPSTAAAGALADEPSSVETEPPPEVEADLERPKVMAAGRRRPLP